jgi:hypothetical protein
MIAFSTQVPVTQIHFFTFGSSDTSRASSASLLVDVLTHGHKMMLKPLAFEAVFKVLLGMAGHQHIPSLFISVKYQWLEESPSEYVVFIYGF